VQRPVPGFVSQEETVRPSWVPSAVHDHRLTALGHRSHGQPVGDRGATIRPPVEDVSCATIKRGGRAVPEVEAHITGTVWKIECQVGDTVQEGDTVVVLESMKMEMPVEAEDAGVVSEILCEEGQAVNEGDTLVVLDDA
jgi:acetyl-CoA carboxylase biotin carboxyl carrier protein